MKSIAVFCGSSPGYDGQFMELAHTLGQHLAGAGLMLIYGGASVGLMGAVADGALARGGRVVGVLPEFLNSKEIAHAGLTELMKVSSMHERKLKMHELSDGVIALPGGYGTLEEYFEMLAWAQLGLHREPIALLNVAGFYDGLLTQADTMLASGFLKPAHREMMLASATIEGALAQMQAYTPPVVGKWLTTKEA